MTYLFIILITFCTYQIGYSCATSDTVDRNVPEVMVEQQDSAHLFDACMQAFLDFMPYAKIANIAGGVLDKRYDHLCELNYNKQCIASKKALIALGNASIDKAAQFIIWALEQHPHIIAALINNAYKLAHTESQKLAQLCKAILKNNTERLAQLFINHRCLHHITSHSFIKEDAVADALKEKAYAQCQNMLPHENVAFNQYINHFLYQDNRNKLMTMLISSPLGLSYIDNLFAQNTPESRLLAEDILLKMLFEVELCTCREGERCSEYRNIITYKHDLHARNNALTYLAKHLPEDYQLMRCNQKAWDWYSNTHAELHIMRRYERLEGRHPFLSSNLHTRPHEIMTQLAYYLVNPPAHMMFAALEKLKTADSLFAKGMVRDALLNALENSIESDYKIKHFKEFFDILNYAVELCHDPSDPCCTECTARNHTILDGACAKLFSHYWHKWYNNQESLSWFYEAGGKQKELNEADRENHDKLRKKQRTILNEIEPVLAFSANLNQHKAMHNSIMRKCSYDYRKASVDTCDIWHLSNIARYAPSAYQEIIQHVKKKNLVSFAQALLNGESDHNLVKQLPDDLRPTYVLQEIYDHIFQGDKQIIRTYLQNRFPLRFLLEELEPSHHKSAVYPVIISCAQIIAQHYPEHVQLIEHVIKKHMEHIQCPIKEGIEHWYTRLLDKGSFLTIPGTALVSGKDKTPETTLLPEAKHTINRILYLINPRKSKKRIRVSAYQPYCKARSAGKKADAILKLFTQSISPVEYKVACKALFDFTQTKSHLTTLSDEGETEHGAYCNAFTRLIQTCAISDAPHSSHMYRLIKRIVRGDASFHADQKYVNDMLAAYIASPVVADTHKYEALSLLFTLSGSIELAAHEFACPQWKTAITGQRFASWYQLLHDVHHNATPFKERISKLHALAQLPHAWQLVLDVCKEKTTAQQTDDSLIWAASDCFTHAQQSDKDCFTALHILKQMPEHYTYLADHLKPYKDTALKQSAVKLLFAQQQSAADNPGQA